MGKLTEEQIEEIKKLRINGNTIKSIANQFGVCLGTIHWHTNDKYRERWRAYRNEYRKKREYWKTQREYQKEYQKRRYKNDEEFRLKHLERSKNYQRRKNERNN